MKKLAYLSVLAGFIMTGCIAGDYGIKPADPQTWEQEEPVTLPAAAVAAGVDAIDLAAVEGDSVAVATLTPLAVDDCSFLYTLVLDGTYKYSVGADMKVPVADLQAMVEDAYGKRPAARTFSAVVNVDVLVNGQASLIVSNEFEVVLTPKAPFIDSAYYLVGDMASWDAAGAIRFSHSGKDVYEDSEFSVVFTTPKDGCYWKIIPAGNYAGDFWAEGVTGVVGVAVDGDTAAEGTLVTEKPQAGKIEKAGMYKMTINMMDYTYSISALASEYYLVGDNFAWNVNEKKYLMYAESTTVMSYTGKFDGNLKMINGNDMGTENWAACYGTPTDGDTSVSGSLQQNAGAIHSPEAGYYTFTADFGAMTYSWTRLENQEPEEYGTIGLVGEFCGWNQADDANQMTQLTPHNWYKNLTLTDGKLKFNANKDWSICWGGDNVDLNIGDTNYGVTTTSNGKDMYVPAGTYDVFFNDITGRFVFIAK